MYVFLINRLGTPVAQWVKRCPTDLAVVRSSHAQEEIKTVDMCAYYSTIFNDTIRTRHLKLVLLIMRLCIKNKIIWHMKEEK